MSKADDIFYREFGVVLLLLTLFTIFMIILASRIGGNAFEATQNSESAVRERIAPVGQVRVGDPGRVVAAEASESTQVAASAAAAESSAPAAESSAKSGEAVYNAACLACHTTGAAGAPKLGDKAAWEPRFAQGLDALVANAIKGKGAMPPKGGNPSWSDEEIKNAIEFMLDKAGLSG